MNDWLRDYAPWIAAVVSPLLVYLGTLRKAKTDVDVLALTDLRSIEDKLRARLDQRDTELSQVRSENLQLRGENWQLKTDLSALQVRFEKLAADHTALQVRFEELLHRVDMGGRE